MVYVLRICCLWICEVHAALQVGQLMLAELPLCGNTLTPVCEVCLRPLCGQDLLPICGHITCCICRTAAMTQALQALVYNRHMRQDSYDMLLIFDSSST